MKKNITNLFGFSLLEFVIVTVILMMLSILTSASIHHLKATNRNAKRVADILELQTALEMYHRSTGKYPATEDIKFGQEWKEGGVVYMGQIPSNPQPRNDGDCGDEQYTYEALHNQESYLIEFCISSRTGDVGPGSASNKNQAIPGEIISCIPNCVGSCDSNGDSQGSDGCGGTCDNMNICETGWACIDDHCIKDL